MCGLNLGAISEKRLFAGELISSNEPELNVTVTTSLPSDEMTFLDLIAALGRSVICLLSTRDGFFQDDRYCLKTSNKIRHQLHDQRNFKFIKAMSKAEDRFQPENFSVKSHISSQLLMIKQM